jgi:hypothetical protein
LSENHLLISEKEAAIMEENLTKKCLLSCVLLIVFFLASVFPIPAQQEKGPKMVLKEREVDFGEVKEGDIIKHTFSVLNQGDEPLEIVEVKPG